VELARIAVLGAGNGGCAAAADLARRGYHVALHGRSPHRLAPLLERGGIAMAGVLGEGFVSLPTITDDVAVAVDGADLVMLAVPVSAHPNYAAALAPILAPEQVLFLNPGHMGGGLFVAHEIHRIAGRTDVRTCEVTTLTYVCRMKDPATVNILKTVTNLAFAAFPGRHQAELFELMRTVYPDIVQVRDVLETGFLDINAVEHPAQIICNAGWVEATEGGYLFYYEGTTPAVGRVIDRLDAERMAIAAAAGIPTRPFVRTFFDTGYTTEAAMLTGSAHAALQESAPNRWITGPRSLDHRYVHEDIGWGLVPWSEMGRRLDVTTGAIDALISLGSVMNGIDYRTEGLTLERLGLAERDLRDLGGFLERGIA